MWSSDPAAWVSVYCIVPSAAQGLLLASLTLHTTEAAFAGPLTLALTEGLSLET